MRFANFRQSTPLPVRRWAGALAIWYGVRTSQGSWRLSPEVSAAADRRALGAGWSRFEVERGSAIADRRAQWRRKSTLLRVLYGLLKPDRGE